MFNKQLLNIIPNAKKHIINNVLFQIIGLVSNILLMLIISFLINNLLINQLTTITVIKFIVIAFALVCIKVSFGYLAKKQGFLASKTVKKTLRSKIYEKIVNLKGKYNNNFSSAELLQTSVEGVEQLEIYFENYLPQLFYSMVAPVILFMVFSFISIKISLALFICVPLIPITIIIIQKIAKKLLSKYWGEYSGLADNFLENLQGLNTLKIYSSDNFKHKQMNKQAERFRIVTMKVLSMQLNSIIVMDIVAYGGSALGIIISLFELSNGNINMFGAISVILLSVDFFLPLRILGSYFHIAMNGISASKKIFKFLNIKNKEDKTKNININNIDINMEKLSFSYNNNDVLKNININIPKNSFVSIVGKSGSGKSTIAGILMGLNENYNGNIKIGEIELNDINNENLLKNITLVSANSYIFKGTVKDNLLMANINATDNELWEVLKKVNLDKFLLSEKGLNTLLLENGSNFSGGQCQRLAIARALLHNSEIYIFDEATSNIDSVSENEIMQVIFELSKSKTIILISHRLLNVVNSNKIYVLKDGIIIEKGTHKELLLIDNYYANLWKTQQDLENMGG